VTGRTAHFSEKSAIGFDAFAYDPKHKMKTPPRVAARFSWLAPYIRHQAGLLCGIGPALHFSMCVEANERLPTPFI
jgi:hypothetical protein